MTNARYDTIGKSYDSTRKADPYLAGKMHEFLATGEPDAVYLDIGCGTGNYTTALSAKGLSFTGIDPSEEMLSKARAKSPEVNWRQGTAEKIDLPEASVDGVLASLTIHHWSDLPAGFKEIHRVLKPGKKFVLFTTLPSQTGAYWLRHYFPRMIEDCLKVEPPLETVEAAFAAASLEIVHREPYFIHPELEDRFMYCGKHNPEIYFDEQIRSGISAFSLIANQVEVEQGLRKLRQDIDGGKIDKIIAQYENDLGDYQFLIGRKS